LIVSQEENLKIEFELKKHQINHQVFRYDAGHGFFAGIFVDKYPFLSQHQSFNKQAVIDAWQQVLNLFQKNLKN
jgi:carboxymethylenebutenolidase